MVLTTEDLAPAMTVPTPVLDRCAACGVAVYAYQVFRSRTGDMVPIPLCQVHYGLRYIDCTCEMG
jgi:hypothetical protein